MRLCIDWDDTLVDGSGEWLPGALDGLRQLRRQHHTIVIHSARASYEKGRQEIAAKLDKHRLPFRVEPKPLADLYIDDKALRFTGWPQTVKDVRSA